MCYTSNERKEVSLSIHVFHFENKCENRKWYLKNYFFYFYFLIVHISINYTFNGLRFWMHVQLLIYFMEYLFLDFIEK